MVLLLKEKKKDQKKKKKWNFWIWVFWVPLIRHPLDSPQIAQEQLRLVNVWVWAWWGLSSVVAFSKHPRLKTQKLDCVSWCCTVASVQPFYLVKPCGHGPPLSSQPTANPSQTFICALKRGIPKTLAFAFGRLCLPILKRCIL